MDSCAVGSSIPARVVDCFQLDDSRLCEVLEVHVPGESFITVAKLAEYSLQVGANGTMADFQIVWDYFKKKHDGFTGHFFVFPHALDGDMAKCVAWSSGQNLWYILGLGKRHCCNRTFTLVRFKSLP